MILSDEEILHLARTSNLLADFDVKNVRNCSCVLRANGVFRPETGEKEILNTGDGPRRQLVWELGPSETMVVVTKEEVCMPANVCATYAPLFRLAKQGVMLLNASVVEPGYSGPLSCFLANFSASTVTLRQDAPIAKIVFHAVTPPARVVPEVIGRQEYEEGLAENAKKYHRSFMDVEGIEKRAADKARSELKGWVLGGGIMVAILVSWASLEPIVSKWLWEKTGLISSTGRVEDVKLLKDIQSEQSILRQQLEQRKANDDLAAQIQELKREIAALKKR